MKSNKLMVIAGLILASAGIQGTESFVEKIKGYGSTGWNYSKDTVVAHPYYTAGSVLGLGLSYAAWKLYFQNKDIAKAQALLKKLTKENAEAFAQNEGVRCLATANRLQYIAHGYDTSKDIYNAQQEDLKNTGYNVHRLLAKAYRNKGKIALSLATLALTGYGLNYYTTPAATTAAQQPAQQPAGQPAGQSAK